MSPVKRHRIVRRSWTMPAESDQAIAAIESAENEGWPSVMPGAMDNVAEAWWRRYFLHEDRANAIMLAARPVAGSLTNAVRADVPCPR